MVGEFEDVQDLFFKVLFDGYEVNFDVGNVENFEVLGQILPHYFVVVLK